VTEYQISDPSAPGFSPVDALRAFLDQQDVEQGVAEMLSVLDLTREDFDDRLALRYKSEQVAADQRVQARAASLPTKAEYDAALDARLADIRARREALRRR
jgi:hypothetical protein